MHSDRRILSRGRAFRAITSLLPDAPTIVLLHGIGASHRYLSHLHDELARTNTLHSIDLPGFAGLPKPDEAPDVPVMAAALARVLDRLGVRQAVVVGHSMGAQWAVELAVQRPDLARAVVAIGPVSDRDHRSLLAQAAALARDILGEPLRVNAVVFADYLRCGPVYFLRESGPMIRYPIEDRARELEAPLLVVRGGNDPIASTAWCTLLSDRAAQGSVVEVPGHRHVVQHTAPLEVAAAIRALMASIPTASVPPRSEP
ncbi:alpha/beta fold hydrolase [Herbiconiux sp. YIM B11900]|uniref:alpha/beta fold hydrolase n=1 Tax=Herbiconiux sp. YIM B11900 TaxID=3404131 RepID=UPI003F82CE48